MDIDDLIFHQGCQSEKKSLCFLDAQISIYISVSQHLSQHLDTFYHLQIILLHKSLAICIFYLEINKLVTIVLDAFPT